MASHHHLRVHPRCLLPIPQRLPLRSPLRCPVRLVQPLRHPVRPCAAPLSPFAHDHAAVRFFSRSKSSNRNRPCSPGKSAPMNSLPACRIGCPRFAPLLRIVSCGHEIRIEGPTSARTAAQGPRHLLQNRGARAACRHPSTRTPMRTSRRR
uniref:Uncharacterized protein n=1 Tax=Arundo donax TaxID=35708 RepID=A0A0A9CHZ1_ARUDO